MCVAVGGVGRTARASSVKARLQVLASGEYSITTRFTGGVPGWASYVNGRSVVGLRATTLRVSTAGWKRTKRSGSGPSVVDRKVASTEVVPASEVSSRYCAAG